MEWHPNEPDARYRVLLGLLGNEYRDAKHSGYAAFNPNGTGPGIGSGQRGVTPPTGQASCMAIMPCCMATTAAGRIVGASSR